MRKERGGRAWGLFIMLAAGALMGSIAGEILGERFPLLARGITVGLVSPFEADLRVLWFQFGLGVRLNLASAAGILMALFLGRRL